MGKPGLRLRVLLLLGALMALSFPLLHLTVWTNTKVLLQQFDEQTGSHRERAVNTAVELATGNGRHRLSTEVWQQIAKKLQLAAVLPSPGNSHSDGPTLGSKPLVSILRALEKGAAAPTNLRVGKESFRVAELTAVPGVWVAWRNPGTSSHGPTLVQAFALYSLLVGAGLLLVAFFALTRWLVQPLDRLARAAENVALGSRRLAVPAVGVRELDTLATSVHRMAARLLNEEESLRHKMEEIQRTTAELHEAQQHLVRSERLASVGRLSAGLAHEIGNPLAALAGLIDLLQQGQSDKAEQEDFLKRMQNEVSRIHNILSELLQLARPSGRPEAESSVPGDVATAVEETLVLLSHQPSMKSVHCDLDIPSGLPQVALSDPALRQVLMNLLLNAADALAHTPAPVISLRAVHSGAAVELAIRDNGPGIGPSDVERVFDPFFTTKDVGKGTGLGLAVCQGLVEAAGGTIRVSSAPNQGAQFVLHLPSSGPAEHPEPCRPPNSTAKA